MNSVRPSQISILAAAATMAGCISVPPPPPVPRDLEVDATEIEVWSEALAGAEVTIAGETVVLDESGTARISLRPGLRGTAVEVTFARDGATLTLSTNWDDDFALTQTAPETRTDSLVLRVMRAPDGRCTLTRPRLDAAGVTRTETLPRTWEDRPCEGWTVRPPAL